LGSDPARKPWKEGCLLSSGREFSGIKRIAVSIFFWYFRGKIQSQNAGGMGNFLKGSKEHPIPLGGLDDEKGSGKYGPPFSG